MSEVVSLIDKKSPSVGTDPATVETGRYLSLPVDWLVHVEQWAEEFNAGALVKSFLQPDQAPEIIKKSLYETMKFCHRLQPLLKDCWALRFQKTRNLNIKLYPAWCSDAGCAFLFRITPDGKNAGVIWFGVSEKSLGKAEYKSAMWHICKAEDEMRRKFGTQKKIYNEGAGDSDRLFDVVREAISYPEQRISPATGMGEG